MSPEFRSSSTAGDRLHERARSLAAQAVDADLEPVDAAWLVEHLDACPDCSAVADEYRAQRLELRSLPAPEPPRDLWARTSAGMDAIDARTSSRRQVRPSGTRAGRRPLFGTAVAVGIVVLVATASLLAQSPIARVAPGTAPSSHIAVAPGSTVPASEAPQAPLAVVNGTSYWIASDQGVYQIKGSSADCVQASGSCTVSGGSGQTVGSITSDTSVSAVLAPDASQAAVWTADKIAIVPLAAAPQTVPLDLLTPRPTQLPTPTIEAVTPPPTSSTTPEVPPSSNSMTPNASPIATPSPTATATGGAVVTKPTAILDGYEVVGRDPEFSADGGLVAFSARPVDHSTGPDLFIWKSGDERARAVTTGHADIFAGWLGRKIVVSEIAAGTGSGATAGGSDTIVTRSYIFDPANGDVERINRPMLVAGADPTGRYLIYWQGTVEFDPVSGLWQPGKGDLYFDDWANLRLEPASLNPKPTPSPGSAATASPTPNPTPGSSPSPAIESPTATAPTRAAPTAATPTAATTEAPSMAPGLAGSPQPSPASSVTPEPTQSVFPQLLSVAGAPASVRRWTVRWDAAGHNVAVWVADPGSPAVGRLGVFSVDPVSGLLDPTMAADEVLSTIGFDDSNLIYTSAMDGKTYVKPVPVIPPPVSTPAPPARSLAPASAGPSGTPAPASDRPGS